MGETLESYKYQGLKREPMDQQKYFDRAYPDLSNVTDDEDESDFHGDSSDDSGGDGGGTKDRFSSAAGERKVRHRPALASSANIRNKNLESQLKTDPISVKNLTSSSQSNLDSRKRSAAWSIRIWLGIALFVGLIIAGGICWMIIRPTVDQDDGDDSIFKEVQQTFETDLKKIKQEFGKQSKATWVSILAAVRMTTSKRQPKCPGVISLIPSAVDPTTENTVRCLARKLAMTLQRSYNDTSLLEIDGERIDTRLPADVTMNLDEQIHRSLQNEANHVVLISNFDRLPARSGMLFHGLCDTDNAPVKQAIYLLTVSRRPDAESTVADADLVDAQVTTAWKSELSDEERQSLETRIGNNIVLIFPENKDTLQQVC